MSLPGRPSKPEKRIFRKGAIFGKIGIRTAADPQFPSSAVPRGARRYQFMVRDEEKFKETGGWGYALFDVEGKLFSEDRKKIEMACYACHQIVQNRGQVFSQPFDLSPFVQTAFLSNAKGFQKIEFAWTDRSSLKEPLKKSVPQKFKRIRTVSNANLIKNIFQGTLDEIKPSLEREVVDKGVPAALISEEGGRFSIVLPVAQKDCKSGRSFEAQMTLVEGPEKTMTTKYCNP